MNVIKGLLGASSRGTKKKTSVNQAPPRTSKLPDGDADESVDHSLYTTPGKQETSDRQVQTSVSRNENGRRITKTTVQIPSDHLATSTPRPSPPHVSDMAAKEAEKTRDLVKKFIADIWNRGEIDLIPEVCSKDLRINGNAGFDKIGHDGLARMVSTIRNALEDYHCEIHSMVVEHNRAFCRLRFTGKHVGNLLGYEPTHKNVAWMGASEFSCKDGKIAKIWELGDAKTLEDQLMAACD